MTDYSGMIDQDLTEFTNYEPNKKKTYEEKYNTILFRKQIPRSGLNRDLFVLLF